MCLSYEMEKVEYIIVDILCFNYVKTTLKYI